jgi:RHS repeat-associated protein
VTILAAALLPTMWTTAEILSSVSQSVLSREPQLTPARLGDGSLAGLQFANPAEQMVVIDPPEPNYQGGAELEHPLLIPPGRGGFQPKLALTYDSAGGNGWVGTGWDLSVGEISVDTRWGVPRYDTMKESETYLLDGQVLNPTAVRAVLQDRVRDRSDFTRRVETEYELIIRHGNSPATYWWEVRDKMGGIRWYGGHPDDGGPTVDEKATSYPSLVQDPSAILFDDAGNAYRWALSAQRDVGVNMIRYFYEKTPGQRVGAASEEVGRELYLRRILYTAGAEASGDAGNVDGEDPAYEVRFLRDADISPRPAPRKDVIVDARGGFLQVTSDLLRRVEVWHGAPAHGAPRTYNMLSRRYDLRYQEGAYGKTLLKAVDQIGSDGITYGTHAFDYYDDVRNISGAYTGFGPEVAWNTGGDNLKGNAITDVPLSALGASETNVADFHAYFGFNPSNPTKNGSFGGAFTINGGATEALAEMMDINGDGLPDKVFREQRGGPISYRLNTSGPSRTAAFGTKRAVTGLNKLSTEFNIGLQGSIEAHFGVIVQFMFGGDVTVGEEYFTDVNSDGLPDFVSAGTVYFNRLDASGNPTFDPSSSLTLAPITANGTATLPAIQAIQDLESERRKQSPLQDTIRRWVAPFNGTISIDAPVALEPPTAPGNAPYAGDGVRVAIQHNGNQLWTNTLKTVGTSITPVGLAGITVVKGDRLYFRVQAIDDGARDQVRWNPTVTYSGTPSADANGLSQKVYRGASDFTLAGRPNMLGLMPLKGKVRFEGTLFKSNATTDDVTVLVLKNGVPVFQQLIDAATVSLTGIPLTGDFTVVPPAGPTPETLTGGDRVEVRIAVDSPIDVTALRLDHSIYYIEADPVNGQQIPLFGSNGVPTIVLKIPADTDIYPQNTLVAPREPWVSDRSGTVTAKASLTVAPNSGGGEVIVTVKSETGIVAKKKINVPDSAALQSPSQELTFEATSGTSYWFDFSIRNPNLSDKASGQTVKLEGGSTSSVTSEEKEAIDLTKMSTAGRAARLAATGRLDEAIEAAKGAGPAQLAIAVDTTGQHIVVGANDSRGFALTPVSISGFAYSDDGGASWVDGGTLPITTPTETIGDAVLPQLFGNPQVKYLGGSNFIYFSIMVKKFSENHAVQTISFHRSTDYGHTWNGPYEVAAATNPHALLSDAGGPVDAADKQFIDVDPDTGRLMMSWNNFSSEFPGMEMSTIYTDNIMDTVPEWSRRVVVSAIAVDHGAMIPRFAGGGSNEAYLIWPGGESGGKSIQFARSMDNGATWSQSTSVSGALLLDQSPAEGRPVHAFPTLAVDNSGGINQGHLYLVYVANSVNDRADIAFQVSRDGGWTFSSPILLNSRPGDDRGQWFPWVTVDKDTGRVHVSYYDQSIDQIGDLTETTQLFSDDAGATWSKPAPLTDRPFRAVYEGDAGQRGLRLYQQAVAQNGRLYAAWARAPRTAQSTGGEDTAANTTAPDISFKQVSGGQASLRLGKVSATDSNSNGTADAGELLSLTLPLENYVTNPLNRASISAIRATLSSATSGVSILEAGSVYPNLQPGESVGNNASYMIALAPTFVSGTPIDLVLTVLSSESPAILQYTLEAPVSDVGTIAPTKNGDTVEPGNASVLPEAENATDETSEARAGKGDPTSDEAATADTVEVPSVLNWAGRQGAFPISYRGWGYVGYNGDGARATQPVNEVDFELSPSQFPQTSKEPTGFPGYNDPNYDPSYQDVSKGNVFPFLPTRVEIKDANDQVIGTLLAWGGMKDSILGSADLLRTSRRGVDSPSLGIPSGAGVQAVRRVSVTAPVLSLTAGIGPASASFGTGPSFGLVDYTDLNGDGFPDIVAPGYVKYTGPRGGFTSEGTGVSIVNQDTTFSVATGIGADGIKITGNAQGDVGSAQNSAAVSGSSNKPTTNSAATGGTASKGEYGAGVGGSVGFTAAFTNPNATSPEWSDELSKIPTNNPTAPFEQELADVNGDGLPDRVLATPQGVYVRLNLGYRFDTREIRWATGGFESNESFSGSVGGTFGFSSFNRDFSAGLGLSESIDVGRYAWVDVDGDGILDRLRKDSAGPIMVAFGTNSVLMAEVPYGTMADGTFDLLGAQIPVGQQIALGRSRGVGAGFDFTIGVGPLCIAACYLIINPGVHFDHSVSNTQIQLTDIDGDGFPDSVKSMADNQIMVRLNNRGRTNLLKQVRNPLGGSIRLSYKRDGNTVSQPNSVWTLASVEVDDGRPGNGVDVRLSTYEYSGGRYDRLEREMLGYSSVIERQRAFAADGNVADDPVLRHIERTYLNNNVFDSGLLVRQTLSSPTGAVVQESRATWSLIDLATKSPANLAPTLADPAGQRLLTMAVSPLQTRVEQRWFDASGAVGQETWRTYEYDGLGNVVRQVDIGEPELADDDLIVKIDYTTCSNASDQACGIAPAASNGAAAVGGAPPYWNSNVCPTWTSLPAHLTITTATGTVLRERDGAPALCDNSSVTDLKEWFGPGATDFARTELNYDAWGSYNIIEYPENATGQRLTVNYVYDNNSHANIADTTDSHGLRSTATFDGLTGRVASRTDANGQVTSYTYDAFGRVATITGPYEQASGTPTVRFEYHADAAGHAYGVARNFDVRHPGDTIDTATFVDGIGRQIQTKQDAAVFKGAAAVNVMIVSPAVDFDSLGRTVRTRYPVTEPLGTIGTYNTDKTGPATTIEWDLLDRQTKTIAPAGRTTNTVYDFGGAADFQAKLFRTTVTDPLNKPQTTWTDVHNYVIAVDDEALGAPRIRTRYSYDPQGQLIRVTDNAGNVTTHTYDRMGRRIATQTPDGGLVETRWDGASNQVAMITPNLRKSGQQINYSYDIDNLIGIDYPDATPDVLYTYGAAGAPGNAAGRVMTIQDAARFQSLTYDKLGTVATENSTMFLHNGPSGPFTTSFTREAFGRLLTVTYPDGEVLTHQYDSGGLLSSLQGRRSTPTGDLVNDYLKRQEYDEFQSKRYQEFGNGSRTEYTFDPATRWLARQLTATPQRTLQDLNYDYDAVGNVLQMDNRLPPPQTELKGGPSRQTYRYDPFYRLQSATGSAPQAPNRQRDYTYGVTYDLGGNIQSKVQRDTTSQVTQNGSLQNPKEENATTYTFNPMTYNPARPHQLSSADGTIYSYDDNGNLTRIVNTRNKTQRIITWDAADRAVRIDDASNGTDYRYDHRGLMGVQRDSLGESAFVNDWYQTTNGGWTWRQIWAGEDRIVRATEKLDNQGNVTKFHYYQHEDLQGSTNLVTDSQGLVFEHQEYIASGELWITEKSTTNRTPYRFVGAYNDEARNLDNLGQRWYEPREQLFYSPEPLLNKDPQAVIGDPGLLPAYSYAESNPLRLYDNDGLVSQDVQKRFQLSERVPAGTALAALTDAKRHSRLWYSLVRFSVSSRADKLAAFSDFFEAKPLFEFKLSNVGGRLRLSSIEGSLLIGKQKALWERQIPGSGKPDTANLRRAASSQLPGLAPGNGSSGKGGQQGPGRPPKRRSPLPAGWLKQ